MDQKATPWRLFRTFFGISALTIGGGYAMIPVFAAQVTKKGWMEESAFFDLFAVGQALPGPMALNTAMLVGFKLAGAFGGLAAFLGIILPPFVSIVVVSLLFRRIADWPFVIGFIEGTYGVILGLVAGMLYKLLTAKKWPLPNLLLMLGGAAALAFAGAWALPIFVAICAAAYFGSKLWES